MWNLKYHTNNLTHKTGADTEDRPVVATSRGWGGGAEGWTGSLELAEASYFIWNGLYSTENYIQYPVIPQ